MQTISKPSSLSSPLGPNLILSPPITKCVFLTRWWYPLGGKNCLGVSGFSLIFLTPKAPVQMDAR